MSSTNKPLIQNMDSLLTKYLDNLENREDENINFEFEVKFGTSNYYKYKITRIQYENVIKKLKSSNYLLQPNTENLITKLEQK